MFHEGREKANTSSSGLGNGSEGLGLGLGWEESRSLHKPPSHTLVQFPGAEGIGILAGQITGEDLC